MAFIRPEARAEVMRWREVIIGVGAVVLGVWFVSGPGFLLAIPGYASLIGGAALIWVGLQRGRFRSTGGGAGAVQVDEGQVTYFGPLSGGMIALREMESLTLDGAMYPAHWRLTQKGVPPVLIPVNAEGADALFDVFASLPGIKTERMLAALKSKPDQAVLIWQRGPLRPEGALLH